MKKNFCYETLCRGYGWMESKLRFVRLESATSCEKQPPQAHSITAWLSALAAP